MVDPTTLFFVFAAMVFLYAFIFVFPLVPIDLGRDGPVAWEDGMRLAQGEVMYRDFFQFVTPGTGLVYALLFRTFGIRAWVPAVTLLLLGTSVACVGVMIARRLMGTACALLVGSIFLEEVFKNALDPTHHWFSVLAATASVLVLMERRTRARIFTAGAFAGLATCFTQTRGVAVAAGLAVFLAWEARRHGDARRSLLRRELLLLAGCLAVFVAVNSFFIWKAGLARYLWCTVVFPVRYYPQQADANTLRVFASTFRDATAHNFATGAVHWTLVFLVIPFIPVLFFLRYWREGKQQPVEFWTRPMLLAIVGVAMLLSVAPGPSTFRVALSELPEIILLGWFLDGRGKLARGLVVLLTAGLVFGVPYSAWRARQIATQKITTPAGELACPFPRVAVEYQWISAHTRPGDYFFAAGNPKFYFYMKLRNPSPLPFVDNNGYTTREQVTEVIRELAARRPRYAMWPVEDASPAPAWRAASDDHLGPLRVYVRAHYHMLITFPGADTIWERND